MPVNLGGLEVAAWSRHTALLHVGALVPSAGYATGSISFLQHDATVTVRAYNGALV